MYFIHLSYTVFFIDNENSNKFLDNQNLNTIRRHCRNIADLPRFVPLNELINNESIKIMNYDT